MNDFDIDSLHIKQTDCLLIIDVQNDFCTQGALAVPDAEAIIPVINALTPHFTNVVMTQDWHPDNHSSFASVHPGKQPFDTVTMPYGDQTLWPDHCIQGSIGAEFHSGLLIDPAQMIIRKGFRESIDSYSAFFENDHKTTTGLSGYLQERSVNRVVCVGLALDYCVRFSAIDACKAGFATQVIESACRGIDVNDSNNQARSAMRACGVELL